MLLDEPAGGVNPSLIQHIADRIRELNAAGKTFLIVEHNMDFVMGLCDHVTVLDYGTVVATGPPQIIRSDPRVLDAYLGLAGGGRRCPRAVSRRSSSRAWSPATAAVTCCTTCRMTVAEGGITCVVGPNGAGKSTLLATISGLLRPRRGSITFRGEPLVGKSPRQILDLGLVHVPQNHSLFRDMTVRENIELGGYIVRDRALIARRRADIEQMFPQVASWAGRRRAACPAGSSGWWSSPAA